MIRISMIALVLCLAACSKGGTESKVAASAVVQTPQQIYERCLSMANMGAKTCIESQDRFSADKHFVICATPVGMTAARTLMTSGPGVGYSGKDFWVFPVGDESEPGGSLTWKGYDEWNHEFELSILNSATTSDDMHIAYFSYKSWTIENKRLVCK